MDTLGIQEPYQCPKSSRLEEENANLKQKIATFWVSQRETSTTDTRNRRQDCWQDRLHAVYGSKESTFYLNWGSTFVDSTSRIRSQNNQRIEVTNSKKSIASEYKEVQFSSWNGILSHLDGICSPTSWSSLLGESGNQTGLRQTELSRFLLQLFSSGFGIAERRGEHTTAWMLSALILTIHFPTKPHTHFTPSAMAGFFACQGSNKRISVNTY